MKKRVFRIVLPAMISMASDCAIFSQQAFAITYFTVEQAQEIMASKVSWRQLNISLSDNQIEAIEELSDVSVLNPEMKVWISPQGQFFIVDNVLGKHEFITYAVLLSAEGSVEALEILDYRENYGEEIRRPEWRAQFIGKNSIANLEFEKDILNISGATISCSHVTKGVTRLLATYQLVLKDFKAP